MKTSFLITARVIAVLLLLAILLCSVVAVPVVRALCEANDLSGHRVGMSEGAMLYVTVMAYLMLAVAAAGILFLWCLLGTVKRGEVFTQRAVGRLFAVSLCTFGEALLFLSISTYFQLAIGAALAAALLGFSLLVVCEVLKEGARIKSENDLTV